MGAVTGKGLSDLIREEFGLRTTFVVMAVLVLANLTNMIADFAGIAGSLEIFRHPAIRERAAGRRWRSGCWWSRARMPRWRRFSCSRVWCTSPTSFPAILVKPDWKEAAIYSVRPVLMLEGAYIYMLIGMVGTSIAPWMQFYLQAAVVEKGVTAKEYKESRIEVIVGCIAMSVIAFFIIVACAGTIYAVAPRDLQVPADAAAGAEAVRSVRLPVVRRRVVQCVAVRGLHPAALDGLFGVRRPGF